MSAKNYGSTVARIAGNLLSGTTADWLPEHRRDASVREAVATARAIIAETRRTEPPTDLERDLDAVMAGVHARDAERAK